MRSAIALPKWLTPHGGAPALHILCNAAARLCRPGRMLLTAALLNVQTLVGTSP